MTVKGYQHIETDTEKKINVITDGGIITIVENDWRWPFASSHQIDTILEKEKIVDQICVYTYSKMYKFYTSYKYFSKLGPVEIKPYIGNAAISIISSSPITIKFSDKLYKKMTTLNPDDRDVDNSCCCFTWDNIFFFDEDIWEIKSLNKFWGNSNNFFINIKEQYRHQMIDLIQSCSNFYNNFCEKALDYSRKDIRLGVFKKLSDHVKSNLDCSWTVDIENIVSNIDRLTSLEAIIRAYFEVDKLYNAEDEE